MKSEIMTWAGPLPPELAPPSDEIGEARETLTFAGPLPAEAWTPPSREAKEIPDFQRSRLAEAKV